MQLLRSLVLPAGLAALAIPAASAGPVVCRTSIEAPLDGSPLVEVSRCAPVTTTPELMEQRFFSYTAPYARGVSVVNQITDVLGIAMGGREGNRVMGLGFPDQTIVWDGSAVENTYQVLLDHQSTPLPWRTAVCPTASAKGWPRAAAASPARRLPLQQLPCVACGKPHPLGV